MLDALVGQAQLQHGLDDAGSAVAEALAEARVLRPLLQLGLPDRFIEHGDQNTLRAREGLDAAGIVAAIRRRFAEELQLPERVLKRVS